MPDPSYTPPAHTYAVEKCVPYCPKCGWKLLEPEEVQTLPAVAWMRVHCAGCDWAGHAKFWTRQADDPS